MLVERVLDGVGAGRIELGPGGLGAVEPNGAPRGIEAPYLQLVMQRLWDVERGSGSTTLRAETLDALGGAGQIVADHLERAIEALTPEQREIAARLFDHLVTPSGTKIAHEASDLAEFAGASEAEIRPVVETLANHRILRTDEAGRWEIFHDVLAGAVLGWKSRHDAERAVARAREESRRRHRRLGFLAFGALVGLALASALAVFAFSQRSDAREQAQVAMSGQLVASALSLIDSDPELGLALALEAARVDPNPRAEDALRRTLAASRERAIYDVGHPLVVARSRPIGDEGARRGRRSRRPADRPSRRRRAVVAPGRRCRGRVRSRRAHRARRPPTVAPATRREDGQAPRRCRFALVLPGSVETLVPSPDGRVAIVIAGKPRARVVDVATGAVVGRVKQPPRVTDAAYAPSGRLVASAGVDRSARLWDPRTWTETRALRGHSGQVIVVAFDPTSDRVATGSTDQTARIWRGRTGALVTPLYGHTGPVEDVAFGPGGIVVTASGDETARTWAADGRPIQELRGHTGSIVAAEFARRDVVVTAGADGTIRTWDPGTTVELVPARGRRRRLRRRSAPTGAGGAQARGDQDRVRLRTPPAREVLRGHTDLVNTVSFSPDGRLLVTAGRDHDVIVWDVASGEIVHRFSEAHSGSVADARFSPDGRWIVTAGPEVGPPVERGRRTRPDVPLRPEAAPHGRGGSGPTRARSSRARRAASSGATSASSAATSTS